MTRKTFLESNDQATHRGCSESSIRNARREDLPARFVRPGSRLVRYHIDEVIAFEKAHFEPRDYATERDAGISRGLADLAGCKERRS